MAISSIVKSLSILRYVILYSAARYTGIYLGNPRPNFVLVVIVSLLEILRFVGHMPRVDIESVLSMLWLHKQKSCAYGRHAID